MRKYVENFDYFFNKDAIRKDNNNEFILDSNLFDNKNGIENSLVKVQDNFNLQKFIEDANTNGKKFEIGVCVHAVDYLFNQIANSNNKVFKIKISYLEIYNEQVMDLLIEKSPPLMIVEDAQKGVTVPDLTEFSVNNSSELIKLIIEGNQRRTMAATGQNQFSSRSHAILQILIDQRSKIKDIKEEYLVSKFLLVDLAGSERGGLEKGMRTHEGKNINKSLLSLGNCINILSDKSKKGAFVPYRDSKLTRLLKDSLGGNIMTVMIACVSPAAISYDETVNTLKYAMRARKIEKKISKNVREVDVHISQYREIIDSLKSEIDQLRQIIKEQETVIHKGNIDIETDKDLSKNQDENNLKISKHISKSNDKINFRSRENSKDKENRINEKNDSEYIKLKEILSLNNKNEKEFSNLKKSTESLDLFKIGEPKGFQSENQINVISKIENRDNLKNSISPNKVYFQKNKNIKSSTQIDHKNTIRDNSLCSSAEQSQKNTYGSLYKKRTYTQNHVNDSKTKNNTSHRIMSDNQENKNNISSPDSINIRDFDLNGYKSFLNKSGDEDFNMEELEKQVEKYLIYLKKITYVFID
jgi:kinesin family protein 18/19